MTATITNQEVDMDLPETEHYKIVVTNDPEHEGILCYGVVNKATEVVEYYDNLLPRTYQAMVHTQKTWDEARAEMENQATTLSLVESPSDPEYNH